MAMLVTRLPFFHSMVLGKRCDTSNAHAQRRRRLNRAVVIDRYDVPESDEDHEVVPPSTSQLFTNWEVRDRGVSISHHIVNLPSSPDRSPVAHHSALFELDEPPTNSLYSFNEEGELVVPEYVGFLEELSADAHRERQTKSVSTFPFFSAADLLTTQANVGPPIASLA